MDEDLYPTNSDGEMEVDEKEMSLGILNSSGLMSVSECEDVEDATGSQAKVRKVAATSGPKVQITYSKLIEELEKKGVLEEPASYNFEFCEGFDRNDLFTPFLEVSPEDYPEEMRHFAVCLNFHSPKSYEYCRKTYGLVPPKEIVADWFLEPRSPKHKPGLDTKAFEAISAAQKSSPDQLLVQLSLGVLEVRHNEDVADFGAGELQQCDYVRYILLPVATCINGRWIIPLGYMTYSYVDTSQQANLVEILVILLLKTNVKVAGVTADMDWLRAFQLLGCKWQYPDAETVFNVLDQEIVFYPDPANVLDSIRDTFVQLGFQSAKGKKINYSYLKKLEQLQKKDSDLNKTVCAVQEYLSCHKTQVKLAIRTFSDSLADVMEFCRTEQQMLDFKNSKETAEFIRNVGAARKMLLGYAEDDKALSLADLGKYFSGLHTKIGPILTKSDHFHKGFIGLLFSLKSLAQLLVNTGLPYISPEKLTLDPVETIFSTCVMNRQFIKMWQFVEEYKKLSTHWYRRDKDAPAAPICAALHRRVHPMAAINFTDRFFLRETVKDKFDHRLLDRCQALLRLPETGEYRKCAMTYIGSSIAEKLRGQLKCQQCVALLEGSSLEYPITLRGVTGTTRFPHESVMKICWLTEKLMKEHRFEQNCDFRKISRYAEREILQMNVFESDCAHDVKHRLLLFRAVCQMYHDMKSYYDGKIAKKLKQKKNIRF